MSRIQPVAIETVPQFKKLIEDGAAKMGFMSIDGLIMAHCPEMLSGAGHFINAVLNNGTIDAGLKRMIGFLTSQGNACEYCSAHTSFTALKNGIDKEKLKAIWDFRQSDLFSDKEKSALDFTIKASMVPNGVTDFDVENLKGYFSEKEVVEIVFTISLYAFLNKFNSTISTSLEEEPKAVFNRLNIQR